MGGETADKESGWTVDTLRLHLAILIADRDRTTEATRVHFQQMLDERDRQYQQRFDAQQTALRDALSAAEKAVSAALTAADRAVAKAETAAEKRFEAVNEFRGQLADQAATLLPRSEADVRLNALGAQLDALQRRSDTTGGHGAGLQAGWLYLVGLAGVAGSIVAIVLALR